MKGIFFSSYPQGLLHMYSISYSSSFFFFFYNKIISIPLKSTSYTFSLRHVNFHEVNEVLFAVITKKKSSTGACWNFILKTQVSKKKLWARVREKKI